MSKRLDWILTNQWPQAIAAFDARVAAGARPEGPVEDLLAAGLQDEAWARLVECDPTQGHEALSWLTRRWTTGKIRGEDLPKAAESIEAWRRGRARLPVEARDIGRHETLASLDRALMAAGVAIGANANAPTSGKAEKRAEAERIRTEESVVLMDASAPGSKGWTMAVPLTEDAAKWWGRGTRWCTASERNNMFFDYNYQGPLIVMISPEGDKYQWHPRSGQLADASDMAIAKSDCPAFAAHPDLRLAAVRQTRESPPHVPNHLRTPDLCSSAVQQDGPALGQVPEHLRTPDLCLTAVQQDGWALWYVPEHLRTMELCLTAVQQTGEALRHVPEHMRTPELCLAAVQQDGEALRHVPEHMLTADICLTAVQQNGEALRHVPEHMLTADICLTAVRQNGQALRHVPERMRTADLCLTAVQRNSRALEYVPKHLRTSDMCLMAVQRNIWALQFVPESLRTADMCLAAVQQTSEILQHVPEHMLTADICLTAVRQNGQALRYVPERMRTADLCTAAMQQDGSALEYVPKRIRTSEMYLAVADKDPFPRLRAAIAANVRAAERHTEAVARQVETTGQDDASAQRRRRNMRGASFAALLCVHRCANIAQRTLSRGRMMRRIVFTIAALAAVVALTGCAPMAVMAGVQLATSALSALDAAAPAPVEVAP